MKKYNIVNSFEDDIPYDAIIYCSISFIGVDKIDKINFLQIRGFKIHNGYTSVEAAAEDAAKLRLKMPNHDIYIAPIGKFLKWDDINSSEQIDYQASNEEDTRKLNDMELKRREGRDKYDLILQQEKNERHNIKTQRAADKYNTLVDRLHKKNKLSCRDAEIIKSHEQKFILDPDYNNKYASIKPDIDEAYKTDYLDVNDPVPLKYGCVTIYSPYKIKGLKEHYIKIRGLFRNVNTLSKRTKKIEADYPNDPGSYKCEVGKWSPYSDMELGTDEILSQLNYCMKCYYDKLNDEEKEFKERMEKIKKLKEEQTNNKNKDDRIDSVDKLDKDDRIDSVDKLDKKDVSKTNKSPNKKTKSKNKNTVTKSLATNQNDVAQIERLTEFLEKDMTDGEIAELERKFNE